MKRLLLFSWTAFICCNDCESQTINYVNNGSFEDCVNCIMPPYKIQPEGWGSIDSMSNSFVFNFCSVNAPISNLPNMTLGFQYPRSGFNLIASTFYCDLSTCSYTNSRGYPKNRLNQTLKQNTAYCVKYYVVNTNNTTIAIDSYGVYLGSNSLDTIQFHSAPLTYLNPQVQNTQSNIISDTLNWIPITGTFVALGTEKFLVLGNFKSNTATNTLLINPTFLPDRVTDLYIDDVSCIELNTPAYAGPDQAFKLGDSLYLGSPRDFAVDELCRWYQLPGNIALDTAAGIWVKPAETSTYVVRQEICGLVKWDTVVVFKDAVGLGEDNGSRKHFSVYPNPTASEFSVRSDQKDGEIDICIYDVLNRIVLQEKLTVKHHESKLKVELNNGIYLVSIRSDNQRVYSERLIIQR